ncbi:MAG: hypothetical protein KKF44_01490 [Nanoarchaeota archaeon]|nr:hypothetical protein [Nanoarchaeota archaeon]
MNTRLVLSLVLIIIIISGCSEGGGSEYHEEGYKCSYDQDAHKDCKTTRVGNYVTEDSSWMCGHYCNKILPKFYEKETPTETTATTPTETQLNVKEGDNCPWPRDEGFNSCYPNKVDAFCTETFRDYNLKIHSIGGKCVLVEDMCECETLPEYSRINYENQNSEITEFTETDDPCAEEYSFGCTGIDTFEVCLENQKFVGKCASNHICEYSSFPTPCLNILDVYTDPMRNIEYLSEKESQPCIKNEVSCYPPISTHTISNGEKESIAKKGEAKRFDLCVGSKKFYGECKEGFACIGEDILNPCISFNEIFCDGGVNIDNIQCINQGRTGYMRICTLENDGVGKNLPTINEFSCGKYNLCSESSVSCNCDVEDIYSLFLNEQKCLYGLPLNWHPNIFGDDQPIPESLFLETFNREGWISLYNPFFFINPSNGNNFRLITELRDNLGQEVLALNNNPENIYYIGFLFCNGKIEYESWREIYFCSNEPDYLLYIPVHPLKKYKFFIPNGIQIPFNGFNYADVQVGAIPVSDTQTDLGYSPDKRTYISLKDFCENDEFDNLRSKPCEFGDFDYYITDCTGNPGVCEGFSGLVPVADLIDKNSQHILLS